jgi:hypothetical protein
MLSPNKSPPFEGQNALYFHFSFNGFLTCCCFFVFRKRLEALNSGMAKRESPSSPDPVEGATPAAKKRWFF